MSTAPRVTRDELERDVMLIDEVAEFLRLDFPTRKGEIATQNVIRSRVYRLIRNEGLTAHRIGGRIRFLRSEVRRWAEGTPRVA